MQFLNNKGPAKESSSTCPSWKQLVDASTTHKPIIDESLSKGRSVTDNMIDASELDVTMSPSIIVPFVITAHTSRITTCSRRGLSLSCSSQQMWPFWGTYNLIAQMYGSLYLVLGASLFASSFQLIRCFCLLHHKHTISLQYKLSNYSSIDNLH